MTKRQSKSQAKLTSIALRIQDVGLSYDGSTFVVDKARFDVKEGETFGLIGLNGAGKTTLIKAIMSMRRQQKGVIEIFDVPSDKTDSRQSLAFLPERFEPPWFLSGREFVKFTLSLYKKSYNEDELLTFADQLALSRDALKRRVQTYSKGMRQKLGLIATLMTKCSLLVLDEPMSGLDPKARVKVKEVLSEQKKAHPSLTIFLSSHILSDMDEICDRVAVLDDTRIKFVGQPKTLKTKTKAKNLEAAFLSLIEPTHTDEKKKATS